MKILAYILVAVCTVAGITICKLFHWLPVLPAPLDALRRLRGVVRRPMGCVALGASPVRAADYWVQVVDRATGYVGGENLMMSAWINRGTLLRVGDTVVFTEQMQVYTNESGTVVETWATGSFSVDCVRLVRTRNAITRVDAESDAMYEFTRGIMV